jgi:AcrR family transcriptional regulator
VEHTPGQDRPSRPSRQSGRRSSHGARPSDDQLLDAARAVFVEHGFATAGMEQIAAAAGCTKPTLYAHFGSKSQLYLAALRREAAIARDWLLTASEVAVGQEDLREQIHTCLSAIFSYRQAHREGYRLLFGTDATGYIDIIDDLRLAFIARIGRLITDYRERNRLPPCPHTDTLAAAAVGAAVFSVRHTYRSPHSAITPAQALAIATDFADAAIRHLEPTPSPTPDTHPPVDTRSPADG